MSYKIANEELKFDVRMRDINLRTKLINEQDVKSFESSLEDSAANAEPLSLDEIAQEEQVMDNHQAPMQNDPMMGNQNNNPFGGGNNGGFGGGFTF